MSHRTDDEGVQIELLRNIEDLLYQILTSLEPKPSRYQRLKSWVSGLKRDRETEERNT